MQKNFIRLVVSMTMGIREDALKAAAEKTLERFPHLSDGNLCHLGYIHKTISLEADESLCDIKGLTIFMDTLLANYVQSLSYTIYNGDPVSGVVSPVPNAKESEDAFAELEDFPASKPVWYMQAKAFHSPIPEEEDYETQVRIHLEDKHNCPRMLFNTDMIHILAPLMSEAIRSKYGDIIPSGEYVVGKFQVDLRPYFHTSTLRPYKTPVYLAYNRSLENYPVQTVFLSQKKLLDAQLKKDTLAYSAQCKLSGKVDEEELASYNVENGGIVHLPESLARYVTDYFCVSSPDELAFNLSMINYNSVLTISITHKKSDSDVCWKFLELLRKYDIPAYISDEYRCMEMSRNYNVIF